MRNGRETNGRLSLEMGAVMLCDLTPCQEATCTCSMCMCMCMCMCTHVTTCVITAFSISDVSPRIPNSQTHAPFLRAPFYKKMGKNG